VAISELSLVGRSAGLEAVEFEGQAVSGGGRLTLSGRTRLVPSEGFPTVLSLRGKEFVVVDIPEAWMPISPDLTLKSEGDTLLLSGELYVPRARLRPRSQPEGTVSTSADVVVVSGQAPKPRPEPKLHTDVRLRLGDQVSFEGFGLRARFEGNLVISQEPRRPAKGNGQVNIRDGTYKAYGQDLTIENGRVIFADSPVENPGLDIRAVRKVDNVTAGVRVTGTLKNPKLAIFSDPAMSQSEALSYLVLGRPLERGAGTDKASAQALVDQAAVAGGGLLAKEVGRQLGLDDVRLERSKSGEDLSLLVGTYLSPKLYAQYVTSIQTKSNRLRLRYDLTPRVEIQTETGDAHGLDVFYKIER
jgi:translocation and assembly module TamB